MTLRSKRNYTFYIFFCRTASADHYGQRGFFLIIRNSEMEKQKHDMTNIANAVSYNISSVVNNAGEMAKRSIPADILMIFYPENMIPLLSISWNTRSFSRILC